MNPIASEDDRDAPFLTGWNATLELMEVSRSVSRKTRRDVVDSVATGTMLCAVLNPFKSSVARSPNLIRHGCS